MHLKFFCLSWDTQKASNTGKREYRSRLMWHFCAGGRAQELGSVRGGFPFLWAQTQKIYKFWNFKSSEEVFSEVPGLPGRDHLLNLKGLGARGLNKEAPEEVTPLPFHALILLEVNECVNYSSTPPENVSHNTCFGYSWSCLCLWLSSDLLWACLCFYGKLMNTLLWNHSFPGIIRQSGNKLKIRC